MQKRRGRSLNAIYSKPLPLTLSVDKYGELPPVTAHNPVSWAYLLYQIANIYFRTPAHLLDPKTRVGVVKIGRNPVFYVTDKEGMDRLWQQGFFGKGTLSRSDPSWEVRVQRRLNIDGAGDSQMTNEDVTQVRRGDRKAFKALRSKTQSFEALERKRALTDEEKQEWEELTQEMEAMKGNNSLKTQAGKASDGPGNGEPEEKPTRDEDLELIDPETKMLKRNLESLQLQKIELFFLHFALDAVEVIQDSEKLSLNQVFRLCTGETLVPENRFLLDYAVYHHFRSLGWCVRSGIKFGCDMLLYKRGPPFSHAEYAILVIPNNGEQWTTWEDFMAVARVVSGVKKTLVLVYVDIPSRLMFDYVNSIPDEATRIHMLFQQYRITEVIYKRWSPSRTRD